MTDFLRSPVDFVGPFQQYEVVVHGHRVPFLHASMEPGGRVHLSLDDRLGLDLSVNEAERVVPFLADSIAVALGYTCHPNPECEKPPKREPFTRMVSLSAMELE